MRGHEPNSSNSTDGTMIVSYRRKLKRCWAHLTADRRKFRAFGLLLAVAVVLWAKPVGLLLWARIKIITNIPRTAIAEDEPLLTKMTPDSSRGVPALPESEKLHLSVWPMKDPFRIDQYFMPHTAQNSSLLQTEPKLGGDQAEDLPIREASKKERFVEYAAGLHLQGLMTGPPAMVIINGRMYRTDDLLGPIGAEDIRFRLVEVLGDSIVVEFDSIQIHIAMRKPGAQIQ